MLDVNKKYDLTKKVIGTFENQNSINPTILIMKLSSNQEEKEFLTELINLIFFSNN